MVRIGLKMDLTKKDNRIDYQVPWNVLDVLAVLLSTIIVAAVLYLAISFLFIMPDIIFKFFSCSFAIRACFNDAEQQTPEQ